MTRSMTLWSRIVILARAGGMAFWVTNFAISLTPIAAAYRAAFAISYWPMTLAALVGGLIIAVCVSGLLLAFPDRIPGGSSIVKATLLSLAAMSVIEVYSIAVDADHLSIFHVIGAVMNVPRFLALGVVVGWLARAGARPDPTQTDQIAGSVR
ncbi:MAG TPA: hypothetical protein PK954_19790 [Anaerolineales bacterium]|nr:hypothetical protein [Anaerolineales bacterium]HRF46203.1 hypothetical protein [Anaerolineales bacterium]